MRRVAVIGLWWLLVPAGASAAGWSATPLPRHTGLQSVSCRSSRWCDAVGGWDQRLQLAHWNGTRWTVSTQLPTPRGATLFAIDCRTTRSCVAVGELFPRETTPVDPLTERWDGHRWSVLPAPKPHAPTGYSGENVRLYGVSCPGASSCFAVGNAVPFGAGAAPGSPVIEHWNGRRWSLETAPPASGALTWIDCSSSTACSAGGSVGGVDRFDGSAWVAEPVTLAGGTTVPIAAVSCPATADCEGVGAATGLGPSSATQAVGAEWNGTSWTAATLPYPDGVVDGGGSTGASPVSALDAVSCPTTTFCGAAGGFTDTREQAGALGAVETGGRWSQTVIRRGPSALRSVSCPVAGWCMAVGETIAERYGRSVATHARRSGSGAP